MAFTNHTGNKQPFLERPVIPNLALNWEMALYGLILLLAVFTRFYNLGARVMSHDESMHAYFALNLAQGNGYIHDPRLHGPLQFFLAALSFLLFGASDFTARIPAALFGVGLVILPFWFRPWLGKIGALVTSVGLLISPSLLVYQRYIRNDALIALFTALMALSLFAYMRTRRNRWLVVGAAAVGLALSTKEVALIHGFLGAVFIAAVFVWERLPARLFRAGVWLLAGLVGVLLVAAVWTAERQNILLAAGLLAGVLTIARNVDRHNRPVSSTLQAVKNWDDLLTWPVALALAIFVLLYTAFFTNPYGLISGTYGAVTHWLGQQPVARGHQPGYYYLMLMLLYEFLPFLVGGAGGLVYLIKKAPAHRLNMPAAGYGASAKHKKTKAANGLYPSDGGTFAAYLIFWATGSFVIYSWAGEKMPWLNVHITLPFIFLLGHASQTVLDKLARPVVKARRFWPAAYAALVSGLVVLTVRFAWLAGFVNYDYVNEYLVYAHAAPDIKWVLNQIDNLSQRTAGNRQIKIAYGGIAWPLEWYMRDYPNRVYFGDKPDAARLSDAAVVLFAPNSNLSNVTVEDVEPFLGNQYTRYDYRLVWWPLEDYKDQTLSRLWRTYVSPASGSAAADRETVRRNWESLWQIVFYRHNLNYTFDQWPHKTPMYVFVRRDLASVYHPTGKG